MSTRRVGRDSMAMIKVFAVGKVVRGRVVFTKYVDLPAERRAAKVLEVGEC